MAKIVEVVINEDASFSVDLTGFEGVGCADVIKMFDGIGNKTKEITKPEFRAKQVNTVRK